MIKAGILGADSPQGGELIRLLIYHPEIELVTLYAPAFSGRTVNSIHTGLMGERIVNFTDKISPEELDIIFVADSSLLSGSLLWVITNLPELKIVMLDYLHPTLEPESFSIGLSEINRKALVRGATRALLMDPVSVSVLISLYPIATFMLLNDTMKLEVSLSEEMEKKLGSFSLLKENIGRLLKKFQPSFSGDFQMNIHYNSQNKRSVSTTIELLCSLSLEEVEKIYDSIYDDHNFTFTTFSSVSAEEVAGTQKCLISLSKPEQDLLRIHTVADGHLRGGAGDAVHVMNLLLGLYEKTGLQLKASEFGKIK